MKWRVQYPTSPRDWPPEFAVIENRSATIVVFGWLRLFPVTLWVGGLLLAGLLGRQRGPEFAWPASIAFVLAFVVPVIIDRSRVLDPVDFVSAGPSALYVRYLVRKRAHFSADVARMEVWQPGDQDYDEGQRGVRFREVRIRFRRGASARLRVTDRDAGRLRDWATGHYIPVVEFGS